MIQFFIAAKLLFADLLLFKMCLTNPQRNVMHNMINMQSYNHISQKNIWLSSQVFREIAVAKFHGNRCFRSCDRVWLFDSNLLSEHSSVSYIIRRFPADNYMFKVNNRNTRTRCEISSKLTIKTPEGPSSLDVFGGNFWNSQNK